MSNITYSMRGRIGESDAILCHYWSLGEMCSDQDGVPAVSLSCRLNGSLRVIIDWPLALVTCLASSCNLVSVQPL